MRMKRIRFTYPVRIRRTCLLVCLVITAMLLLLGACTQSEVEDRKQLSEEVEGFFSLSVQSNVSSVTRAVVPLDETQEVFIKDLWVGQYAPSGTLVKEQYFASLTLQDGVDVRLSKSEDEQTVYLVANAGNLQGKADKADDLLKLELDYASTADGKPSGNTCMMVGSWQGTVDAGGISGEVELTRLVAKISFTYSVGGTDFSFTPSSVSLRNVPVKSRLSEPDGQLADISYRDYTEVPPSGDAATIYWYLPENKAGIASREDAVDSEKRKTGKGVANATYIELKGTAVQNKVTYPDVCFKLYPGSGSADNSMNDYMIRRNNYYALEIRLTGIDFSDERVSLGKEPDFENPDNLGAEKGASKSFQVTSQPGKPWSFMLPNWLAAKIGDVSISAGSEIGFQGPARIEFTAVTANPKAEERKESIVIDNKEVVIIQNPSSLSTGSAVSLAAESGSAGGSTFTATKGLPWVATLVADGGWLGWQDGAVSSGNETQGSSQSLLVKAVSANPSASPRNGKITVKGGSATDGVYNGLTGEVTVSQNGSTLSGSTVRVAAALANNQSATFNATKGLSWSAATVADWLSLIDKSGTTTGSNQSLKFNVTTTNPSSSTRTGKISVRAGNAPGTANPGPSNDITVNQDGSVLNVNETTKTIPATASTGNTSSFTATAGLSWSVGVESSGNWLTLTSTPNSGVDNTSGNAQSIIYSTPVNLNSSSREGTVTVKVGNAINSTDGGLTKTIKVTQLGSSFTVSPETIELSNASTSGYVTVKGTNGLPWEVSPAIQTNGITPTTTSSIINADQTLTFTSSRNTGKARETVFTIAVKGGNHSKTVKVKQAAILSVVINQDVLQSYYTQISKMGYSWADFSPFDANGVNTAAAHGINVKLSSSPTMEGSYAIQVERGQNDNIGDYSTMQSICLNLNEDGLSGWRLPTQIELHALFKNKEKIKDTTGTSAFIPGNYWSSSIPVNINLKDYACILYINDSDNNSGAVGYQGRGFGGSCLIRCVRDL